MSKLCEGGEGMQSSPWLEFWPEAELETVSGCPVCGGGGGQNILHENLIDNVFFVAQGAWTLYQCLGCASAYLNPRPSPQSIGKAYGTYYTHKRAPSQVELAKLSLFRRLRRMLANGYLNCRYGAKREPSSRFGTWLVKLLPAQRSVLDMQYRYLPKPTRGQRLLDVGCGNGDFLVNAIEAGWLVTGLEPDAKAAKAAQERGLDIVVGVIDVLAEESCVYDVITLSHVIEHVHEPRQLLQSVHRLLKPGGVVYIDTPNINSLGAELFKQNWRGIETPRHLVLFTHSSLETLLIDNGFGEIVIERRADVQKGMFLISKQLAAACPQGDSQSLNLNWFNQFRMNAAFVKTNKLEYITLTARKTKS